MFLAIDIGNTHTVLGVIQGESITQSWRIHTDKYVTADELAVLLDHFVGFIDLKIDQIEDIIISCVVPPLINVWEEFSVKYIKKNAIILSGDMPLGMPILYRRPHELGVDRIVNAIGAYSRYKRALIVIDYGTAITFDCISAAGEYLGGSIAPGVALASEALFHGTSKLPRVRLFVKPKIAIGQDTNSAIQAGIIYGFAGLTDGIVRRLVKEFQEKPKVIATGGLASIITPYCDTIEDVLPDLTLEALAIIYKRLIVEKHRR